ncbi:MAG: site-specific integrase [Methyloglobulus sp.]
MEAVPNEFTLRIVKFQNGERYPFLVNSDGSPLWHPTLFITTQIRNANKATNTMVAALSAIRSLLVWCHKCNISLEARFSTQYLLNEQELESLALFVREKILKNNTQQHKKSHTVKKLESARQRPAIANPCVTSNTLSIRIAYISEYLGWLAIRVIERDRKQIDTDTWNRIDRMVVSLKKRKPQKRRTLAAFAKKGITETQQEILLELVKPGSKNNPFTDNLQKRNQLIVLMLYCLGLRAGELLALRISDIDFQDNTLLIARRHNNPLDPRAYQPVVKTSDRRIPLSEALIKAIYDHIMQERCCVPNAKYHDFLLVTHQNGPYLGQPLSAKGLSKVFSAIVAARPNELTGLTPHILRHTTNDRFSDLMEQKTVGNAEEEKLRSYLMGWREGSGTSATYTRRHVESKSHQASLNLQNQLWKQ